MVDRLGIAKPPTAITSGSPQPSSSGAGAFADTIDALGREAVRIKDRLQPIANDYAKDQAGKAALEGNFNQKRMLVEEDAAYNNAIESAYHARMATDVETTIATLVRDHPIDAPIDQLKAQIYAAKDAYIKRAPSAYAMSTGAAWDKEGSSALIRVADAQKANQIKNAAKDIDARISTIEDRLSNADNINDPDVVRLIDDAKAQIEQLRNPIYGLPDEVLNNRFETLKSKIIMRGLVGDAKSVYEKQGYEASRAYLENIKKRTDIPLPDSVRDGIVNDAWGEIRFTEMQRRTEEAQARAEQRAALAQYKQELRGRMQDAIIAAGRGIFVDGAPKIDEIEKAFGSPTAAIYEQAIGGAPVMAEMKTSGRAELNGILNASPPDANKPGFKEAIKLYDQRRKAAATRLKMLDDDPMRAHIESGVVDPGDVQTALRDPASMSVFLRTRAIAAIQAGGDYGTRPAPLTKAEAQAFGSYLDKLDGESRARIMAQAAKAMGKDGAAAYRNLVTMLKPSSAPFTQAGQLFSLDGAKVGKYDASRAGQIIMAGDALLNPTKTDKEMSGKGGFAMPKDEELARVWNKEIGTAYAGLGRTAPLAFQVYRAAYAGLANDAGQSAGEFDRDIAKEAARIASGGVGKWGEQDVLLPWGMSESEFQNRIANGWPNIVAKFPELKNTKAEDWGLMAIGDGRYWLKRGDQAAMTKDGRHIELRVRR